VARAKRTNRAAARRRYRETHPDDVDSVAEIDDTELSEPAPSRSTATPARRSGPARAGATAAPPPRPGFMGALRNAVGRPDIAGDIRALPDIALHSRALWVPLLAILVASILFFMPGMSKNPIVAMIGQIALTPPPMIMPFLGGMLAPRGAWLVGGIIGLANSLGYLVLVLANTTSQVTPLGWTYAVTSDQKVSYAVSAMLQAVPFGILVGAFAGFYRRFLAASSPQRQPSRSNSRKR
jgi:hypothetical protein